MLKAQYMNGPLSCSVGLSRPISVPLLHCSLESRLVQQDLEGSRSMPVARPETSDARIIAHIDMDCFYVQVEQRKRPELRGLPTAVVQYNSWKGGGLIAVSYEARKYGVKRSMRGDEAKKVCSQIQLVQVPVARGKADLSIYRDAGSEVVSILAKKGRCERASIDEVYLDLSDAAATMLAENPPESFGSIDEEVLKSHILGLNDEDENDAKESVKEWLCKSEANNRDKLLACGALIVAELRMQVLKETEFTCSAGVAHNKMLAKLASAMNKPAQQTVVPFSSVKGLLSSFPIRKMKQLGGKLGSSLQSDLGVNTVGDLLQFSEGKLQQRYGINTGTWLWNIARGIDGEEVEGRLLPKSHGSGKTFPGRQALKTLASVQHWLNQLCEELSERLQADLDLNKRIAGTLTLHARAYKNSDTESDKNFPSKSCQLRYGAAKIQEDALNLFQAGLREYLGSNIIKTQGSECNGWGITSLSVSASKIIAIASGTSSIMKYFHGQHPSCSLSKQSQDSFMPKAESLPTTGGESCSGLTSNEAQIDFREEGTMTEFNMPGLDKQELNRTDPPCCSTKQLSDDSKTSCSLGGDRGSEMNQIEQKTEVATEKPRIEHIMHGVERHEQKKNKFKDKGTSSILRFFKNQSSSSVSTQKQELPESIPDAKAPPSSGVESVSASSSQPNQVQMPKETPIAETSSYRVAHYPNQGRQVWSYNMDEVDPSVIDELPPEIQQEVRALLRPHKRPNVAKRGSSIAHYFSPMRKL